MNPVLTFTITRGDRTVVYLNQELLPEALRFDMEAKPFPKTPVDILTGKVLDFCNHYRDRSQDEE